MKLFGFKKAQAPINIFLPIMSLFGFGIILLFISLLAYLIAQQILIAFPTVDGLSSIINQILGIYKIYDYVCLTLAIIFIIGIGVTSYRIRAHPVFYIITFVTSVFYGFVAYVLSYMFSTFASDANFIVILYLFPLTILLLTNLHWVALAMIIISAIALYSRGTNQEDIPLR